MHMFDLAMNTGQE